MGLRLSAQFLERKSLSYPDTAFLSAALAALLHEDNNAKARPGLCLVKRLLRCNGKVTKITKYLQTRMFDICSVCRPEIEIVGIGDGI